MARIPRRLSALAVLWILAVTSAGAQQPATGPSGSNTIQAVWLDVVSLLPTQIRLPDGYEPGGSYPLIVGLHGYGASIEDFMQMADYFGEAGVIFAVPQAPYPLLVRDHVGYSWNLRQMGEAAPSEEAGELSLQYIVNLTTGLAGQYATSEVYLMGFSQGAAYALLAGLRHADLFRGIVALAGGLDPRSFPPVAPERIGGIRIFIGHSPEDRPGSFERAQAQGDSLTERGFDVTFHSYPGGHTVTPELLAELFGWIDAAPDAPER